MSDLRGSSRFQRLLGSFNKLKKQLQVNILAVFLWPFFLPNVYRHMPLIRKPALMPYGIFISSLKIKEVLWQRKI